MSPGRIALSIVCCLIAGVACAESPSVLETHWAYQPLAVEPVPATDAAAVAHNEIDAFLEREFERHDLKFNPLADRATLLRRVSFDLTGLPPTWEEVEAFQNDPAPDAYERLVDRLLASPSYGERMAVQWLDLAHYADTHGYHADTAREMWRWRDWVIEAFNQDLPFDQFTRLQVAGDLLPRPSWKNSLATGFFRNHMINSENGAIDEEYRAEYVADRVNTLGTVWLGQTLSCARCHDHKYDPISQTEFYQLAALFNQLPENGVAGRTGNAVPTLNAPTRQQQEQMRQIFVQLAPLEDELELRKFKKADGDLLQWEKERRADIATNIPPADAAIHFSFDEPAGADAKVANQGQEAGFAELKGTNERLTGKHRQALLCDGSTILEKVLPVQFDQRQSWSASVWIFPTTEDRLSIVSVSDELQSERGWEAGMENGHLFARLTHCSGEDELFVRSSAPLPLRRWQHVAVVHNAAENENSLQLYLDGKPLTQETVRKSLTGHIVSDQPLRVARLEKSYGFRGMLDEVQLYLRPLTASEVALIAGNDPVGDLLRIPTSKRSPSQQQALRDYYFEHVDPVAAKLRARIEPLRRQEAKLMQEIPSVMVLQEGEKYRPTYVLERGLYNERREEVQAAVPRCLTIERQGHSPSPLQFPSGPAEKFTRLDLANWLMQEAGPLTARVAVNRAWQLAWGRGLVATAEDFGTRGTPPSHPALLDWLSREFIVRGWSEKALLRQIVTSRAYCQSSEPANEEQLNSDPLNVWCARGPRGRLSAEMICDAALAESGLLVNEIGGRSVVPLQPGDLWRDLAYDADSLSAQKFKPGYGADLVRRSVYTFWKRSAPPPNLCLLDAPDRETTTTQRGESNSPLQALLLLNDVTYSKAAGAIAQQVLRNEGQSDLERCQQLVHLVLQREPTAAEADRFLQLLQIERARRSGPAANWEAWSVLALTVLNLDEALTKR